MEKELFELVNKLGDSKHKNTHIIADLSSIDSEEEKSYRVYHSNGVCFDIEKKIVYFDDGGEETIYPYFCEFDGFKYITPIGAYHLLTENL